MEPLLRYRGRAVTGADVHFIRELIAAHPAQSLSPIGIKEPGMIGVMERFSGEENGHPSGVKNGRISQRRQEPICGWARP